ncbi:MAG: hypothetical protein GTO45_22860 [Candidatus Aminicenantes bacterium]|nr:hypothetical protein [Candidatus Aminicenantes bacterium]NIM81604.1 hypothetical protein [Candidatus Aminicenantes bacterium]NIN20975.1 hypothetical protein [Candidatus Aminicenantes bacterium]NIN44796.1 hypothetical protein [Candidatus Aminicenantes bacterium]NIN87604.1 hypothetical protein [Candidatus Aminicenantes bacterium]
MQGNKSAGGYTFCRGAGENTMNKRIRLFFSTEPFIDTETRVELHRGIRLLAVAQFMTSDSWSKPESAIVDTGAPISLIPYKIWRKCLTKVIGETELRGVIAKKECVMPVKVAKIELRLIDPVYMPQRQ